MEQHKNEGWICPKCGRVNAPWVAECSCSCWYHGPCFPIYPTPYYPAPPTIYSDFGPYYKTTSTCGGSCVLGSSNGTLGDK